MKKIFTLSLFTALAFSANAQQATPDQPQQPTPSFSNNLSMAIVDFDSVIADLNKDFAFYSKNYSKVLAPSKLYNTDNKDLFADFYEAFNYNFNSNFIASTPMIKNMPSPGPNLDYWNVGNASGSCSIQFK